MPNSQLSSAQEARESIAARLGDVRKDAGLTGHGLAVRCGWSPSKVSRIEAAKTRPSDTDIHAWCHACGADGQAPDLVAASRTADSMYREWKQLHKVGLKQGQDSYVPLYQRTRHTRVYCSSVIPGLLQTQPYAEALLSTIAEFRGVANDSVNAAEARVERSKVLYDGTKRFAFLIEEDVLRFPYGGEEAMAGQLGYLMTAMSLPNVSLGVIPRTAPRRVWTLESFLAFDDQKVQVETLSANVMISRPSEIELYLRAFEEMSRTAVYGAKARGLILEATSTDE